MAKKITSNTDKPAKRLRLRITRPMERELIVDRMPIADAVAAFNRHHSTNIAAERFEITEVQ